MKVFNKKVPHILIEQKVPHISLPILTVFNKNVQQISIEKSATYLYVYFDSINKKQLRKSAT